MSSSVLCDPPLLALHHLQSSLSHPDPLADPALSHQSPEPTTSLASPSTQPSEPMPATPQDDPEPPRVATPSISSQQQISCANCGAVKTPLWRRDADGKTVCNACGLYQKNRNTPRPTALSRRGSQQPVSASAKGTMPPSSPSAPSSAPPAKDSVTSTSKPSGTCPGDGRCDGTGGNASCDGCPTYNNSSHAQGSEIQNAGTDAEAELDSAGEQRKSGGLSCANCKTSTTPLWRRDDVGNNICNACGLYLKLHGTHRPFSMKKAVIKRRKRVPAAAAAAPGRPSGRLSDQAAAEALVSVGRGMHSTEEDEGDADEAAQPKRKRQRRSSTRGGASGARRIAKDRSDEDGHASASASPQQAHHPWDAPPHPHTHAGLDLPPLAHLMPQADMAMFPYMVNVGGPGMFPKTMYHAMHSVPPPASSYMRSSSRAQSPSNGIGMPAPGVGGMFLSTAGRLSPSGSGLPAVPTLEELQTHYREMDAQRRATADMLERTERMMDGLRRAIERAQQQEQAQTQTQSLPPLAAMAPMDEDEPQQQQQDSPQPSGPGVASSPAPAVPLPPRSPGVGARTPRESVWAVGGGNSPRDA